MPAATAPMINGPSGMPRISPVQCAARCSLPGQLAGGLGQLGGVEPLRGSRTEDLLPPLYEPELVAIGHDGLLLRGFESSNGTGYVQEWRCVIQR